MYLYAFLDLREKEAFFFFWKKSDFHKKWYSSRLPILFFFSYSFFFSRKNKNNAITNVRDSFSYLAKTSFHRIRFSSNFFFFCTHPPFFLLLATALAEFSPMHIYIWMHKIAVTKIRNNVLYVPLFLRWMLCLQRWKKTTSEKKGKIRKSHYLFFFFFSFPLKLFMCTHFRGF